MRHVYSNVPWRMCEKATGRTNLWKWRVSHLNFASRTSTTEIRRAWHVHGNAPNRTCPMCKAGVNRMCEHTTQRTVTVWRMHEWNWTWKHINVAWCMTYNMWHMTHDTWHIMYDIWHMKYDIWYMIYDVLQGLTFEAKGYGYILNICLYIYICIYT